MIKKSIEINSDFIKLDSLLKLTGEASTGGQAKFMIQNGEVLLNNTLCTQRGKKVFPADSVVVNQIEYLVKRKSSANVGGPQSPAKDTAFAGSENGADSRKESPAASSEKCASCAEEVQTNARGAGSENGANSRKEPPAASSAKEEGWGKGAAASAARAANSAAAPSEASAIPAAAPREKSAQALNPAKAVSFAARANSSEGGER